MCRGLAIDLFIIQEDSGFGELILAKYLMKFVPTCERLLDEEVSTSKMMSSLRRMKLQASRFRSKYRTFPSYLKKYLLEVCNPFL